MYNPPHPGEVLNEMYFGPPHEKYDQFLRKKIEMARLSMNAGVGLSNDQVEAKFAARRAAIINNRQKIIA